MKETRSREEDRVLEAFLRVHPTPTAEDVLRWQRRSPPHEDAIRREGTKAIAMDLQRRLKLSASDAAMKAESGYLSARWRAHRGGGDRHKGVEALQDADEGLFSTPDADRDAVLAALIDACPVPTLHDVRRWRSRHPRYGREIAVFAFDVMMTATEGDSPFAPSADDLLGALNLALQSPGKDPVGPTKTLDR